MQDQFAAVAGENQVDAGTLEIAGEQQMRVRNDNGARRRMRQNAVDVDVPTQMSALAVRQHVGKFAG